MIQGDAQTALTGPNKIILSASLAKRIFGSENPIGQSLESTLVHIVNAAELNYNFTVTGVFQDLPRNTHMYTNALISAASDPELNNYYFNRFHTYTYVLLNKNTNPLVFAPKLTNLYKTYLDPEIEPVMKNAKHKLVPLTKIHANQTRRIEVYLYFHYHWYFIIINCQY